MEREIIVPNNKENTYIMFGNNFYFIFLKTFFCKYIKKKKKKQFSCVFEIKKMFGQLKLEKKLKKNRKY